MLGPYDKSDLFVALTPPISGCEAVAIVYDTRGVSWKKHNLNVEASRPDTL